MSGRSDPAFEETPLHHRSIEFDAFAAPDNLRVVGRLRDRRPWAEGTGGVALVHDIELRVDVRIADLVITAAEADLRTYPHSECPAIAPAFAGLVGLSVTRGFTREVQQRFAGPRGCTHLDQLARSLGPVVIQAVTSARARAVARGELEDLISGRSTPWARDSCHIWAEGGVAEQKLEAGWHPGVGPYPSLPLDEIRTKRASS